MEVKLEPKIDMSKIDETIEKLERVKELLKEANSLVDELTSKSIELHIEC